jgi:hypothetical protein
MAYLRARLAALALSLALVATATVARAGEVLLYEPKSGLNMEIEGGCLARPLDAGEPFEALCPVLALGIDHTDLTAVVRGDDGGVPDYTVDIVTDVLDRGTGEERARAQAARIGADLDEPPTVVTFRDQRFVRGHIRAEGGTHGARIYFVTADERPQVTSIIFTDVDPEAVSEVERNADAVMRTVWRTPWSPASPPAAPAVPSRGSDALVIAFLVIVVGAFGLFVFLKLAFIARLFGFKLGSLGGKAGPISEPRRPRDPGRDGPQVAGMKCAACNRNILSDSAGMTCADCAEPIHKKCHGRHAADAHGPKPGAYR